MTKEFRKYTAYAVGEMLLVIVGTLTVVLGFAFFREPQSFSIRNARYLKND